MPTALDLIKGNDRRSNVDRNPSAEILSRQSKLFFSLWGCPEGAERDPVRKRSQPKDFTDEDQPHVANRAQQVTQRHSEFLLPLMPAP
jgi:hypothetical protein